MLHDEAVAGETHREKRERLAATLRDSGQDAAVITLPDSICWLLNIRGSDIPRNPLAQGFAVLHANSHVAFFTNATAPEDVLQHLGPDVTFHTYDRLLSYLSDQTGTIRLDPKSAPRGCSGVS